MRLFRVAHRGARVGICVLALGYAGVAAQEAPTSTAGAAPITETDAQPASKADTVKPEDASGQTSPTPAATSQLPELVVDGKKDEKKKKAAKSKEKVDAAASTAASDASATEPPPGVVLGTSAPSDTGTTTFDANNVQMRTTGGGDANTFLRNLPNVQYQNNASTNAGTDASSVLDTKPALMSISGGRTYENNFILNGVSINNITGSQDYSSNVLRDQSAVPGGNAIYGMSPQNIYVPADFIGKATVIDSNASAEYGQFQGGVVVYDLAGPPTDRYRASVSATHESSRTASWVLATPDKTNPYNYAPPVYDKTDLSASVGAPITKDFSFIAQASRKEANATKALIFPIIGNSAEEYSDNTFLRFAATARTDIGKFTFDTSLTKYFQHWEYYGGHDMNLDTNTDGSTNKLEYETKLDSARVDSIGLGNVNLVSRVYYNTSETQNNSDSNIQLNRYKQGLKKVTDPNGNVTWQQIYLDSSVGDGWCQTVDPATYPTTGVAIWQCSEGGFGNRVQGQKDYGVDAKLTGNVLLGSFKLGAEFKQYEGHRAREEDYIAANSSYLIGDDGKTYNASLNSLAATQVPKFDCTNAGILCSDTEIFSGYTLFPKYDVTATLNAVHSFAEIDQTWKWFNARAGVRLDYDDYFENFNFAPRLAGTITPFDGLSFTGGANRYYLGETLYYAIRDKQPNSVSVRRLNTANPYDAQGNVYGWNTTPTAVNYNYGSTEDLNTPYTNEYTGAVGIRDPLFGGFLRLKYLERYNEDQFATKSCGNLCYQVSNDGTSFYRSKSVEYTKAWSRLQNPFFLNTAAVTGNATWDDQKTGHGTYLLNTDFNGDGTDDSSRRIWYKEKSYRPEEFNEVTGNLDIPVRIGATVSTVWFDGLLELNGNAGINLGYQGVYNTSKTATKPIPEGGTAIHNLYDDRNFGPTLKLDVSGRVNVTEQAAIDFHVDNITNSDQNAIATTTYPWVLGRTFWIGSTVKLQ